MALGTKRGSIAKLFMLEGLIAGPLGGTLGCLLAMVLPFVYFKSRDPDAAFAGFSCALDCADRFSLPPSPL
jgi:hypothetical protein